MAALSLQSGHITVLVDVINSCFCREKFRAVPERATRTGIAPQCCMLVLMLRREPGAQLQE
jgi:hypothetical protein